MELSVFLARRAGLVDFFQVRQRPFQFVLEMADAQQAADARQQFPAVNGLREEIVGPGIDRVEE